MSMVLLARIRSTLLYCTICDGDGMTRAHTRVRRRRQSLPRRPKTSSTRQQQQPPRRVSSIKDFSHEFVRESFTQRGAVMMLNYKIIYTLLLYMYRIFTKLHICAYGKGKKNAVRYIANLDQSSHVVLKFSLTKMWRMRIWGKEYMYTTHTQSYWRAFAI